MIRFGFHQYTTVWSNLSNKTVSWQFIEIHITLFGGLCIYFFLILVYNYFLNWNYIFFQQKFVRNPKGTEFTITNHNRCFEHFMLVYSLSCFGICMIAKENNNFLHLSISSDKNEKHGPLFRLETSFSSSKKSLMFRWMLAYLHSLYKCTGTFLPYQGIYV